MADRTRASTPLLKRGAHAALSPGLGAPAVPASWQRPHWAFTTSAGARSAASAAGTTAAAAKPATARASCLFMGPPPGGNRGFLTRNIHPTPNGPFDLGQARGRKPHGRREGAQSGKIEGQP